MLAYGLVYLSLGSFAAALQKCKCLAGQPCFPSQAELEAFSKTLSHPLISGQRPLGSACYPNSTNFNPLVCDEVKGNQDNSLFMAAQSNALQFRNLENLVINGSVQDCPLDPVPGGTCFQGRVPSYAIDVGTVEDIQNTFRFASGHNLRLVVKNTGHDFIGRGFGVGSVELYLHNLKNITFSDNFKPVGAPEHTDGEHAVTLGAGVEWGDIYPLADQHNRSIAGGFSVNGSVGAAGGWVLGGGHSVLSPFYGLGVDNVLQFTVVLPNASFVTANKYQNVDLFWALRGGGGPSFGVTTTTTFKTHPNVPYTVAFYSAVANSSASYHRLLEVWMEHHNAIADAGWTGPWPFLDNSLFLTFFAQGTPPYSKTANSTMEAFFSASRTISGVNVSQAISVPYRSFQAYNEDNLVDGSKGFGFNFTAGTSGATRVGVSSWLMPRNLTAPENAKKLADIFLNIPVGIPFLVGGGAVSEVDPDATAVTPAWRTTVSDMGVLPFLNAGNLSDAQVAQLAFDEIQPLRELAPPPIGGQYLNEPDKLEVDWQQAFWGRHYPRLLTMKKEIDPHDLLIVRKGVNSEQWDEEIICKNI